MNQTTTNKQPIYFPWTTSHKPLMCNFQKYERKKQYNSKIPIASINSGFNYISLNKTIQKLLPPQISNFEILFDKDNLIICLSCSTQPTFDSYHRHRWNISCPAFLKEKIKPILGHIKESSIPFRAYWDDKKKAIFIPINEEKLLKSITEKEDEEF